MFPFFYSLIVTERGFMDVRHLPLTGQFKKTIKKKKGVGYAHRVVFCGAASKEGIWSESDNATWLQFQSSIIFSLRLNISFPDEYRPI